MKKLLLIFLSLFLVIGFFRQVKTSFFKDIGKEIKKKTEEFIEKGKEIAKAGFDPIKEFANKSVAQAMRIEDAVEKKAKDGYSKVKYEASQADKYVNVGMTIAGAFLTENKDIPKPFFCNDAPKLEPPFINSEEAKKDDKENLIPIIEKYSPVLYLAEGEIYWPMQFSQYCCGRGTSLLQQGTNKVLMAAGTITPESIYNLYKKYVEEKKKNPNKYFDTYFGIQACTKFGADPSKNKDAQGNLTTPAYVVAYEHDDNILLQFIFFYGYNGTFTGPILGYKPLPVPDEVIDNIQGLHESDIEHISMLVDKKSKKLISIYYGAHGTGDGNWIDAAHPDIEYQNGHPIVYPAKWSHGCYPKPGTWVRVLNLANDVTSRGQRWTPKFIRIYPQSDSRFNPKTMGWLYVPGKMGAQGIDPLGMKDWFANVGGIVDIKTGKEKTAGDTKGRKYSSDFAFCKNPPSSKSTIDSVINTPEYVKYAECLASKIKDAPLPPDSNRAVPPAIPPQLKPTKL